MGVCNPSMREVVIEPGNKSQGMRRYSVDWRNQERMGEFIEYYPHTNKVYLRCNYFQGKKVGAFVRYHHIESVPLEESNYFNNERNGYCRFYDVDYIMPPKRNSFGYTHAKVSDVKENTSPLFEHYLKVDGFYRNDKRHGPCWELDRNLIKCVSMYQNGVKHGYHVEWSSNGTKYDSLQLSFILSNSKIYSASGQTFHCYEYKHGKLIRELRNVTLEHRMHILRMIISSEYGWNALPTLPFNSLGALGSSQSFLLRIPTGIPEPSVSGSELSSIPEATHISI